MPHLDEERLDELPPEEEDEGDEELWEAAPQTHHYSFCLCLSALLSLHTQQLNGIQPPLQLQTFKIVTIHF